MSKKKKRVRSEDQRLEHPQKKNKFKLGSGEVELLDCGLEAVQSLLSAQESSYEKEVLCNLEKIGLAKPLTSIWQWQDPQVCEEFIRNWNTEETRTTVFGVRIDVNLDSFLSATGLGGNDLHCPAVEKARKYGKAWKYGEFCGAEQASWCSHKRSPPVLLSDLKNDMARYLLVLFNKTILLGPKNPLTLSKASAYLLVEALQGNVMGWGTYAYKRFMCVMSSSHFFQGVITSLRPTLAGPLMCFLYAHARDKDRNDVSHISRAEFEHSAGRRKRDVGHCAAGFVPEDNQLLQLFNAVEPPCRAYNGFAKRPHDFIIGVVNVPSDLATEEPSSSLIQAQGSKASVPPSTPENPSERLRPGNASDMDTDPYSGRSQEPSELKANVRNLTRKLEGKEKEICDLVVSQQECKEEIDCKNREISRLQQAEKDAKACYGSLECLYSQAQKNVLDLSEKAKGQQEVMYQLTLRKTEHMENLGRLEKLYADEQKHTTDSLKLQFNSAATEGEIVELRENAEVLTGQWRESTRRASFLELQLATMKTRWDTEFPVRKEAMET